MGRSWRNLPSAWVSAAALALAVAAFVVAVLGATVLDNTQTNRVSAAQPAASSAVASTTGAYAYAFVNADGIVAPSMSKNITQANIVERRANSGHYCFNLPFVPKSGQATVIADGYNRAYVVGVNLAQTGSLAYCYTQGVKAIVTIRDSRDGEAKPSGFFVVFDT